MAAGGVRGDCLRRAAVRGPPRPRAAVRSRGVGAGAAGVAARHPEGPPLGHCPVRSALGQRMRGDRTGSDENSFVLNAKHFFRFQGDADSLCVKSSSHHLLARK